MASLFSITGSSHISLEIPIPSLKDQAIDLPQLMLISLAP